MKISKKYFLATLFSIILCGLIVAPFALQTASAGSLWENQVNTMGGEGAGGVADAFGNRGETPDPRDIIVSIIKVFLTFLALIFTVLLILAGYKWMTAQGNQDDVEKAKSQIKSAIIGIVIILCAYTITVFVTQTAWDEFGW